ncbi:hypothetical protein Hanom_Chr03g00216481 [Helianthus anomalus]
MWNPNTLRQPPLAAMGGGFYPDGDGDERWWWFEQVVVGKELEVGVAMVAGGVCGGGV